MIDDPIDRERMEREALDVVLAYYAGTAPLQAALAAIVAVSSLPVPEGDSGDEGEDADEGPLSADRAALPPEEQARADALARAIQEHYRDTA